MLSKMLKGNALFIVYWHDEVEQCHLGETMKLTLS